MVAADALSSEGGEEVSRVHGGHGRKPEEHVNGSGGHAGGLDGPGDGREIRSSNSSNSISTSTSTNRGNRQRLQSAEAKEGLDTVGMVGTGGGGGGSNTRVPGVGAGGRSVRFDLEKRGELVSPWDGKDDNVRHTRTHANPVGKRVRGKDWHSILTFCLPTLRPSTTLILYHILPF
jgi:hypothetical protein